MSLGPTWFRTDLSSRDLESPCFGIIREEIKNFVSSLLLNIITQVGTLSLFIEIMLKN